MSEITRTIHSVKMQGGNKRTGHRGRLSDGAPNPIDNYVGSRIMMRRKILKLNQKELAEQLGITFQQLQKYEHGINRIGASRLWDLSRVLNVPVSFFFNDMPSEVNQQSPRFLKQPGGKPENIIDSFEQKTPIMDRWETLELVRSYYKIENRQLAKGILELLRSLI